MNDRDTKVLRNEEKTCNDADIHWTHRCHVHTDRWMFRTGKQLYHKCLV